jgi:hypothetical protein
MDHEDLKVSTRESGNEPQQNPGKPRRPSENEILLWEVDEIKEHTPLAALLEADGVKINRKCKEWKARCPFHTDKTASFVIYPDQHAHCFGCQWHGDVITYIKERQKCSFPEAKEILRDYHLARKIDLTQWTSEAGELLVKPGLSPDQMREWVERAMQLATDDTQCEQIAVPRNWKAETIKQLAVEGSLALKDDVLAFLYPEGVKRRALPWSTKRFWSEGTTGLWRASQLESAKTIYLTEGESDAITLIDGGILDSTTQVIAVPGATAFKKKWAARFTGKTANLCFDSDEAGQQAVESVSEHLSGFAAEINALDWTEVRRG